MAAFRASPEVCKMLVDAGARGCSTGDKWDNRPSALAARTGRKKSKEYLQQVGQPSAVALAAHGGRPPRFASHHRLVSAPVPSCDVRPCGSARRRSTLR